MQDLTATLLSQYANSPTLLALLLRENAAIDPSADIDAFYSLVWDVDTAVGYGLDVWGRIVGVSRVLTIPGSVRYLGFGEATVASADPFGQSSFYAGATVSQNYILADDAYRVLILVKALTNISNCSIATYNAILQQLFPGRGNAWAADVGGMQMMLVFTFDLLPFEVAILQQSGAFRAPTGVGVSMMRATPGETFGFAEGDGLPFGSGTFFGGFF